MRKVYFLLLLCCAGFATFAQTTVTIFSTAAVGTYTTGSANTFGGGTRTDNNIVTTGATSRGYAVFSLSSIPAGATITSCVIGFNVAGYFGGGGAPSGWNTYGYVGDLSTVTVAAMLFADMVAGTSLSTATYGTATGNKTLVSTPASVAFVQANAGTTISICWTGGGSKTYTITGENGAATTTGTNAPYLQITYTCIGVSGVSAMASPNPLCVGASLTLAGAATGATTYSWSGPGAYSSATESPTFTTTAASAGVYTFTAYNASGCGTQATTAVVALNTTPTSAITPTGTVLLCSGGSQTLTATLNAGDSYQWYQSGTVISGQTNQTYVASNSGNYSVDITDPTSGCSLMSSPTIVSVIPYNPPLIPATKGSICTGSNTTLSVDLTGVTTGLQYQWEIGGANIPGATNSTYSTNVGGVYTCLLTLPSCSILTLGTTLTVRPLPLPSVTYNAPLLSTSTVYVDYQWFLNLVSIPGATSSSFDPNSIGSYRVRVTDTNGCMNYSNPYALNYLGVEEVNNVAIKIYPNPATKMVHIVSPDPVRVAIWSIEGKKLMEKPSATDVDINDLPNGLYLIMLYNEAGERVAIDKLIKD